MRHVARKYTRKLKTDKSKTRKDTESKPAWDVRMQLLWYDVSIARTHHKSEAKSRCVQGTVSDLSRMKLSKPELVTFPAYRLPQI
jgi:hypothetical protein